MRGLFRPARLIWIFGLLLLVGTLAGAGWMLNTSNGEGTNNTPKNNKSGITVPFEGKGIVCFGYVDVREGVAKLHPLQSGRVLWVEKEGEEVKKGADLLHLDDWLGQTNLDKANLALSDAELVLKEAKRLTDKHELEIKAQQAALDAASADKAAADEQVAKIKKLRDEKFGNEYDYKSAQEQAKKAKALIDAEQAKLDLLKKFGPEDKIKRAELDVTLKKKIIEQAKDALKEYKVVAPDDGTILRSFTGVGESIGSNPKMAAIEFCPKKPRIIRAEVLQEWADRIKIGQDVIIEDDTSSGSQWKGKVVFISDWFTQRRSVIQEPFQFNDVRTLECLIEVTEQPQGKTLRLGQRMRVMINQGGP